MRRWARGLAASAATAAALLGAGPSRADSQRVPAPAVYVEECGACHVAFPARMLDAASWRGVLEGLDRHFGIDASVDTETLAMLRPYLEGSARSRPTVGDRRDGKPLLRITQTRWFQDEHEEVPPRLWRGPDAVRQSDCAACHRDAAQGRFSERSLRLPRKEDVR